MLLLKEMGYILKNFSKPFTGKVIGTFRGKMIDGKREGLWFGFGQLQWQANYVDEKMVYLKVFTLMEN